MPTRTTSSVNRRQAHSSLSHDEIKLALKEAHKEWMDEKFSQFGRWAFLSLLAFLVTGLAILIVKTNGIPGVTK